MKRLPDWPQRLARAIDERANRPHVWGQNDCALYAADLIAAVTGEDIGAQYRGRYSDEAGAGALLKEIGVDGLAGLADAFLPRMEGSRPRRGDAVLAEGRYGPFLGIVWSGRIIGPGPKRPLLWPIAGVIAAWSVG